jgi:elongator complex protein 6
LTEFVNNGRLIYIEGLAVEQQVSGSAVAPQNVLNAISESVVNALAKAPLGQETVLILDSLDVPLATESTSSGFILTHVTQWRQQAYATIVTIAVDGLATASAADLSHSTAPGGASNLLLQQQQLVLSVTHQADTVFSTRPLDTGRAKDVSGVVRITPRTGSLGDMELLYFVELGNAKSVEVWERGCLRT